MNTSRKTCVRALSTLTFLMSLTTMSAAAQDGGPFANLDFRTIGPSTMSGRIVDLEVLDVDPHIFYVASSTGGLYKTVNRGVTFESITDDLPTHSIGDVAVHQVDTARVWLGMGERASRQSSSWGDGVWRSDDGGGTWTHVGLADSKHIGRIALHPADRNAAFVAAMGHLWGPNEERGLYRTRDAGATWEKVLAVDENTGAVDVQIDPEDHDLIYAATYQRERRPWGFHGGGPGSALWKSTDGGDTWAKLTNAGLDNGLPTGTIGRIGISIYLSDPRIVYASVEQGLRYNASTAYEERVAGVYRSEDRGKTWEFMSDWNPRPMYASQILVDPSDDQRIYMVNAYSWSDDGGRTFTVPRQSLHGDDRLVWVNPTDSDHVMKADDGGLGISYDRGVTWWYARHLPLSQWYRVRVDMQTPFRVYGGLQDNGSWAGPSATYRASGILHDDWVKWGGGDGFLNIADTTDNRTLYTESQYLGLSRVDMVTGERSDIRPGDPTGAIGARRNWRTWPDLSDPEERLGNAMEPANWDGPFAVSPHDANTIYAGTRRLWRSRDQGQTWEDLGDWTTGADRRTLPIMSQMPTDTTRSLDDGIPYWPTLSAIEESPVRRGYMLIGTDDGQVLVSTDGGDSFESVTDRLPGAPAMMWVNTIDFSRTVAGRGYVAANNYRNDDYGNYAWVTDDFGQSWRTIAAGLPEGVVTRTVREDPRNPDVLYMGTELGLFYSHDGGRSWLELRGDLPTMAINDLVVHPRDNDLVLGTHSRGIWILDNVNALQELGSIGDVAAHLFSMEPAEQIRYRSDGGHAGDAVFYGENPVPGGIIDYWLATDTDDIAITVLDDAGSEVATVRGSGEAGINRAVWNLRYAEPAAGEAQQTGRFGMAGPLVVPGTYTVRLTAGTVTTEGSLEVREDSRIAARVSAADRRAWTETLLRLGALRRAAQDLSRRVGRAVQEARNEEAEPAQALTVLARETNELSSRISRLEGEVSGIVGRLTGAQETQQTFYREMLERLSTEAEDILRR
jgi:photosystem II stability/assembly factor-like uncharacterized protein